GQTQQSGSQSSKKPAPAPARWRGLIGEYGPDSDPLIILEKNGKLFALFKRTDYEPLAEVSIRIFKFSMMGVHAGKLLLFTREPNGRAKQLQIDQQVFKRRQIEPESGNQLRIKPLRPVTELMQEARAAQPPNETGDFRAADLVELRKLDPTI